MKIRLTYILLLALSLACNTITRALIPPLTETPFPTPAYVPPACLGLAFATLPAATTLAEPISSLDQNPPLTTDQQLNVYSDLVSTINEEYLYPDFNGKDWNAMVADYRDKVESGLETESFYTEMDNLVSGLGDEHSQYESPAEVTQEQKELSGENDFVGIGVLIQPLLEKDRLTILSVFPDSAAEHGGLKPHDSLLAVDGIPLVENGEAYPQRVRGPECSTIRLTVQSPGSKPHDLILMRYRISTPQPVDAQLVATSDGSRIGYIFIPTFFDETIPYQIRKALQDFGPLDGLILDNRMNSGGSSTVVEPILSYFTSGTLGHFVSRSAKRPLTVTADPIQNSQTVPLIVLVGEDTVSFGEIFSGIMQDQGRAKIVGQTTLGNVETLQGYTFDDGSRVWIAQERFDPANSHANWEKDGIHPDVEAFADWDTFTFGNDPSVSAALELLGHK